MTARVMARFRREPTGHTPWCARDHRCGVAEHRSADLIVDAPLGGRAVITRVRAGEMEYAELRARIPLHSSETGARWQVATVLRLMREVLATVALRRGAAPGCDERRPAIDGGGTR